MARGRGRGKSSGRSNPAIRVSMPTIPMPTIVSPQQGGTPTIVTSTQSISPTISEAPPAKQNQNNLIGQGLSTQNNPSDHTNTVAATPNQSNVIGHGMSSHSNPIDHTKTVAATPNQSNVIGQGLSPQGSPTEGGVRPGFAPEHVWERWMQLWGSDECIKKAEINAKNRRDGREVAAIEKGRDPTPSELHLHVHTHGHDGKSFVGERSRIVHVQAAITDPSGNPSLVTPIVSPTTNVDEVDPSISSDDHIP
ncbi:uncharacterized protein LOC125837565 [Solanum verrucosum]|uniref:uncharacterized protein LOC125837565 n=1 Tax=Solanum verrucosum TaxID=315347 RepID=UPI0020D06983|nr:uncharacterized protein LOC125837565 [Solanum verrucosum]